MVPLVRKEWLTSASRPLTVFSEAGTGSLANVSASKMFCHVGLSHSVSFKVGSSFEVELSWAFSREPWGKVMTPSEHCDYLHVLSGLLSFNAVENDARPLRIRLT